MRPICWFVNVNLISVFESKLQLPLLLSNYHIYKKHYHIFVGLTVLPRSQTEVPESTCTSNKLNMFREHRARLNSIPHSNCTLPLERPRTTRPSLYLFPHPCHTKKVRSFWCNHRWNASITHHSGDGHHEAFTYIWLIEQRTIAIHFTSGSQGLQGGRGDSINSLFIK